MGSVLCCLEAEDEVAAHGRAGRQPRDSTAPQPSARHARRRATTDFGSVVRTLQAQRPSFVSQYEQHHCTCGSGTCPRMDTVRPVVDAYLLAAASSNPAVQHADALYRVAASLATFDERREHDVGFVRNVHQALIAAAGDEALAFAVMVQLCLAMSPPPSVGRAA